MKQRRHTAPPTVGTQILRALARFPRRIAFVDEVGQATTYAGTADIIGRYQAVFAAQGLKHGATVALLSANRIEGWCAGVAAQASGMAVTWLHPLGSLDDHRWQLDVAHIDALIVDEIHHAARGSDLAATFTLGRADFGIDLTASAQRIGVSAPHDTASAADTAQINFTGGTTGTPKGVLRRHAQAAAITNTILAGFELPHTPRYLAIAPNSHVGGSIVPAVLTRGGSIHLRTQFDPAAVVDAIDQERINTTLLVPTMIYALLNHSGLDSADTTALELLLYGAAPIAPERLDEGLDRLGPVFAQLYGQTECHPIAYLARADHTDESLRRSCGFPTPATDVAIVDDSGAEVTSGELGEIAVRSPTAMDSFLNSSEGLDDGWIRTGDIGKFDDRGYLYIADRKKDMIITGGFNVYPREVEDALTEHPDVLVAAVFGVHDDHWGEAVTAAVVARPGADIDASALIAHVRSRKGAVQAPKGVIFLDSLESLPRTALGKIDKKALRRQIR